MVNVGEAIAKLRKANGMSQTELAKSVHTSSQSISNYETGLRNPNYEMLNSIAQVFNVPVSYFLAESEKEQSIALKMKNLQPIKQAELPLLGRIGAGEPTITGEEPDTIEVNHGADYVLIVDGDSMEPTVFRGDQVFIREQDDVENGEIAAVILDDCAVLKRITHIPNGLILISDNADKYPPRIVTGDEFGLIKIVGKAISYNRKI